MKKVLLIGGGLAVVGGLAYLYLKNKKKEEAILGSASATQPSATTQTTSTSGASDGGIAPLPKGSTITPTTVDGVTTSVITTPNSALTVKNQTELDDILSSIKKNMDIVNTISLRTGQTAKNNAKRQIELLKNDLSRFGYEYKQGSSGLFLVKI